MPSDIEKNASQNTISSEGFPVAYANVASLAASFADIRIFFAESFPKELVTDPGSGPYRVKENAVAPRICVAMSPEFARSVRDALSAAISQYETQFGALRTNPNPNPQQPLAQSSKTKH
jgi:uncharacterized protein DUF3467